MKGRTYGGVVFDNEPLEAGVTELHERQQHLSERDSLGRFPNPVYTHCNRV